MRSFEPNRLLRNPHAQTIACSLWPRKLARLPRGIPREFETEPGTRILAKCHWQERPRERPTLVLVHGLEGSSDSGYMRGLAQRAYGAGWNAVRLNQRNCGGTEALTRTLYNSGLSCDYRAVLSMLIGQEGLSEIFFAGYSMGGNLILKMAGELESAAPPELRGVAAVCPSLDLAACADAVALPRNFVYQFRFVKSLKDRMRRKAKLFPGIYDLGGLARVRTLREFDSLITARYCGFRDAADYYTQASALRVAGGIRIPALIVASKDDPFVPFASFSAPSLAGNPWITLLAPAHGGHCAFIGRHRGESRFWAEEQIMEFCRRLSSLARGREDIRDHPGK
jgi:uncharacterized protein